MTKRLSAAITNFVSANFPEKDKEELEIIGYGIEGIVTTFFKTIVIFIIGYYLKILLPLALAIASFGLLRTFAAGMHLRNGWTCMLFSSTLFLAIAYAGIYIPLPRLVKTGVFAVSFLLLYLYAPADTEERPLVCEKNRRDLKTSAIVTAGIIFVIAMILPEENIVGNVITWGVIIESVMTTPMIYYIFRRRYRNYEYYES